MDDGDGDLAALDVSYPHVVVERPDDAGDSTGLDLLMVTGADAKGAARNSAFDEFAVSQQKEEAFVLKHSRRYGDESGKRASHDDGPPPEEAGGPLRKRGRGAT